LTGYVATAFHGEPPTPDHVVDHIDTNRRNNRPENIRWLTRLENTLLNPITVKRIELVCGSVEAYLEDPSKLLLSCFKHNLGWMRTVTSQEAKACLERMHLWAKSDKQVTGSGSLGEWVFKPIISSNPSQNNSRKVPRFTHDEEHDLVKAKTQGAAQRKWRTPTEFPCCPQKAEEPIKAYAARLTTGAVFSCNDFSTHEILKAMIIDDGQSISVMCESDGMKPWSLAKITFEDGLYVHTSISTFFSKDGAEKQFSFTCNLNWTGGDNIDDYC